MTLTPECSGVSYMYREGISDFYMQLNAGSDHQLDAAVAPDAPFPSIIDISSFANPSYRE